MTDETTHASVDADVAKNANANLDSHGGISIRIIGAISIVVAILLALFAFSLAGYIADAKDVAEAAESRYIACSNAIDDLEDASDYLTTQARLFVVTGDHSGMDSYLEELYVTDRRGHAVELLRSSFSEDVQAANELQEALKASDDLAESELTAMRLAAECYGITDLEKAIAHSKTLDGEQDMTADEKLEAARNIMLGEEYQQAKATIKANVEESSTALLDELNIELADNNALIQNLLFQLRITVALLLCVVMVLVLVLLMYVLKPLNHYIKRIEANEPLVADGSYELRYLANAYNAMYEDNSKRIKQLREFAERDPLTRISNRNGYDNFLATHTRNVALILIDIDNFKEFNKVYGRDTGNAVLVKLAHALCVAFRSTDFPCRIDGDTFAVVMTNMGDGLRDAISGKINLVNSMLADDSDDLPLITLSVGAAFSTEGMSDHEIYDAVLMDIQMPVMNGYEATKAIRAQDEDYCKTLPIVAMSANAYDEDVKNCLAAGMNAHIAKPFNPESLLTLLNGQIKRKAAD